MEFNGLLGMDFDFFKKKDKMTKEEYETARNEVKQHFRSLCYEVQKIYHKKTGGVLELDKEFQNFNKRSNVIIAECKNCQNKFKVNIHLGSDNLSVELFFKSETKEQCEYIIEILKNKKSVIWEYFMSNKYMMLCVEYISKTKKISSVKMASFELNNKNYSNILKFIEDNFSEGRYEFNFIIAFSYNKNECLKQNKNFANTVYEAFINIMEIEKKLA
ncbi:hypothetical protein FDN13_04300 [Caloramator sp. E03]|uniref:hypothetical protein n=1 Tax=Caloramator sp. E03 TaxID=2576307 RepID=UPI001110C6F1|nr:hypothetical protein [Caloramator sp. E03]QCX32993.1 hypothetical protein FDN13_04300 [Caloramator sp. E03]